MGRHPKIGKKKGDIKVYTNERVQCDVEYTSVAKNDSFMLIPMMYGKDEIVAMDRRCVNNAKFKVLTKRDVVYVTKIKETHRMKYALNIQR